MSRALRGKPRATRAAQRLCKAERKPTPEDPEITEREAGYMFARNVFSTIFSIALVLSINPPRLSESSEPPQEWELIGKFGLVRTLYVSPDGLKDKFFVAQMLHTVMNKADKSKPIQIMMFDDRGSTPKGYPMTDSQMLHLKAKYNRNPNTKYERFVWVSVIDPKSSPPKLKETEAIVRPGYAE